MANPIFQRPDAGEYAPFYAGYIALVPETDVLKALREQVAETTQFFGGIPDARAGFRYAPDKWSIREVIGHMADAERIFSFRALTIARGDRTELPGFDENDYVRSADFDRRPLADLIAEFEAMRSANLLMLENLSEEAWTRSGVVNGNPITARALAYIMAGHVRHHMIVLKERYLAVR